MNKTDVVLERLHILLDTKRHSENERLLKEPQKLLQRLRNRETLLPDSRLLAAMMLNIAPQSDPAGEIMLRMPEALALRMSEDSALFLFRLTDKNKKRFTAITREYVSNGISTGISRQFGLKDDLESAIEEARAAAMTHFYDKAASCARVLSVESEVFSGVFRKDLYSGQHRQRRVSGTNAGISCRYC